MCLFYKIVWGGKCEPKLDVNKVTTNLTLGQLWVNSTSVLPARTALTKGLLITYHVKISVLWILKNWCEIENSDVDCDRANSKKHDNVKFFWRSFPWFLEFHVRHWKVGKLSPRNSHDFKTDAPWYKTNHTAVSFMYRVWKLYWVPKTIHDTL